MKEKINELLKEAMKSKNKVTTEVYRSLKADIETAEHNGFTDIIAIIAKAKKKRLDAAAEYQECGRGDLMEAELLEADIIGRLLPKEPTDEELFFAIHDAKILYGNTMGMIIKDVKIKYPAVNGKKLAELVKMSLNNEC